VRLLDDALRSLAKQPTVLCMRQRVTLGISMSQLNQLLPVTLVIFVIFVILVILHAGSMPAISCRLAFIKYCAGMGEKWFAVGAGRISLQI
jgi:hypothetical protein